MIKAIAEIKSTSDKMYLDDLYRTYAKMLTKLALSIVHDNDCAADVVTTAMLSLFSLISKLRGMEEPELVAYLCKTVRHAAYKCYKANKRRSVTEIPLDSDLLFSLPGIDGNPAEELLHNEDFHAVREAIATLSEKDRRLLYLKYAADLTAEEIADLIGAPSAAAVRERLSRTRRKVLTQLVERGWSNDGEQEHPGTAGAVGGQVISTDY